LELYNQLKAIVRTSFSVINYENALRPRVQIYEKIAMDEI